MTSERLRAVRDASPFRPFTVLLADGRSLRVPHRDFLSVSPGGRTVIIYQAAEAFSVLDLLLVTELAAEGSQAPTDGEPA